MSTSDSEGPAWNKFWLSLDQETESMVSGEGSNRVQTPGRSLMSPDPSSRPIIDRVDSVLPGESASHNGDDSHSEILEPSPISENTPFPFKFKAPSGRVHRLQVSASGGMTELITNVTAKLGTEIPAVGGEASFEDGKIGSSGYALSYLDNEGDTVSITTDQDLIDAISIAQKGHRDKVDLFVHDPTKPPMTATLTPHPTLSKTVTPPASVAREQRRQQLGDGKEEDTMDTPVKRGGKTDSGKPKQKQQQLIPGVPNDLLLPGAIVTLAFVIVSVFAISRSNNR